MPTSPLSLAACPSPCLPAPRASVAGYVRLLLALVALVAMPAWAATTSLGVLLDTDNQPATGCTVIVGTAATTGIDKVVTATVMTTASGASVTGVSLSSCAGAVMGAPQPLAGGSWPVGLGQGNAASALVEMAIPLAQLPPGATLRAVAFADNGSGAGGTDTTSPFLITLRAPGAGSRAAIPVPLSPWLALALGVAMLAALHVLRRRYPGQLMLVVVAVIVTASGVAWAASVLLDGNADDWRGVPAAVSDATGDAGVNADIVAAYHQQDARDLFVRIDADIRTDGPANAAPVVDAGAAQSITLPAVANLAGTASDDGLPNPPGALTLAWTKVSGPGSVSFSNAASASTTATFGGAGVYVLQLAAHDGATTTSAQTTVTVNAGGGANSTPVVSAGANQTIVQPAAALLVGTASDDGLPAAPGALTLHWSLVSGPGAAVLFGNDATATTSATFGAPGTYVLRLAASDGALTGSATVTITVQSGAPSLAAIADRSIVVGEHLHVPLVAADYGATGGLTYALPTAPGGATLAPPPVIDWTPTGAQLGTHTFTATVTNAAAQSASVTFHITVSAPVNHPPKLAPQADQSINAGVPFARTLGASDVDGDPLTFSLVSGPTGMSLAGAELAWPTAGVASGDHAVTVRVTDSKGLYDSAAFTISVRASAAPLAVDDSYTVQGGATLDVSVAGVLANDVSATGAALSAQKLTDPDKGSLAAFNADGSFSYVAPNTIAPPTTTQADTVSQALLYDNTSFGLAADINHDGGADVIANSFGTVMAFDGKTGVRQWYGFDTSPTSPGKDCKQYLFGTDFALGDVDGSGGITLVQGTNCDNNSPGSAMRLIALDTDPAHAVGGAAAIKWLSERLDVKVPLGVPPVPTYLIDGDFGLTSFATPTLAKLSAGGGVKVVTRMLVTKGMYAYDSDGNGSRDRNAGCYAVTGNSADSDTGCKATFIVDAATGVKEFALTAPNPLDESETPRRYPLRMTAPVVADLDGDGQVEIVSGSDVYRFDGIGWSLAWQATLPGMDRVYEPQSVAVADLDGDGKAEVVMQAEWQKGSTRYAGFLIYRHDGVLLHSVAIPQWDFGLVSIFDVNGDGTSEILITARGVVHAYRPNGTLLWASVIPDDDLASQPEDDPALAHWPKAVGDRTSSGSSVQAYDLDLDGHPEVIVSGTHRMAIFDGRTGRLKASMHNNATVQNNAIPLLVDANGDGHADIVSSAGNPGICNGCPTSNILAFSGIDRNWAPAPRIFNQVNYNPWAINDAGAIAYDGAVHRSFRMQRQLGAVVDPRMRDTATFTYAAVDSGGSSAPATVSILVTPPNSPPVITSTPPTAVLDTGDGSPKFIYQIAATDPDVGDTIRYELVYSQVNTAYFPQATVDPVTGILRSVTGCGGGCDFGPMIFMVAAIDSFGARTEQSFIVDLTRQTRTVPAVVGQTLDDAKAVVEAVQLVPDATEVFSAQPIGTVVAQDPVAATVVARSATVTLSVSKGLQPVVMPFVVGQQIVGAAQSLGNLGIMFTVDPVASSSVPAGQVMTQAPAFGALLTPGVDDPAIIGVSIGPPLAKPVASIIVEPGESTRLVADKIAYKAIAVFSDGTSADVTLRAAWSSSASAVAGVDVTGVAKALVAGDTTISASLAGKSAAALLHVKSRIAEGSDPVAAITAPADDSTVYGRVDVTGTASDANFLRYELAYAPADSDDWTPIIEGSAPVTNGVLGSFNPSVLLNDLYTLRLRVYDRGDNMTEASVTVQVAGQRKVGLFSIAFEDLALPSTGVPIAVIRTYDSRDKTKGDFGIGWRQSFNTLRIRANRVPGTGWTRTVSGPTVSLNPTSPHTVSVTLADGSPQVFDLQLSPTSNLGSLDATHVSGYIPRTGTRGTLTALGNLDLLIIPAGSEAVLVDDNTFELFAPTLYRYVGDDGTSFDLSPADGVHRIADRNGNTVSFGPDGILHSDGKGVAFTRDADARIVAITDPMGHVRTYAYDANGDLASATDPLGNTTRFSYDRRHGLLEILDPSGQAMTRNEYDDAGRLVAIIDANGNHLDIAHDDDAQQNVLTDRRGHTTTVRYDAIGNILSSARVVTIEGMPTLATETSVYDALGNPTSQVDADGKRVDTTYADDRPLSIVSDPAGLGLETQFSYTSANLVDGAIDAGGRSYAIGYDAAGNIVSQAVPGAGSWTSTRDSAGRITQTVDAQGTRRLTTYDGAGNAIRDELRDAADHLLRRTDQAFDANGNRVQETRYRTVEGVLTPFVTRYTYDALKRQTSVTDALGNVSRTEYDQAGRVSADINALGARTEYAYDALGRLILTRYADGSHETDAYDANNNVVASTNRAGRTSTYTFDETDRRVAVTRPGGATTRSVYSAGGQLMASIGPDGERTDYSYDTAGRQTSTRFPAVRDGVAGPDTRPQVSRALDAGGRELSSTDADGRVTTYEYDTDGHRTRTVFADGSHMQATYDALGRRTSVTNEENETTQFAYDALGRIVGVSGAAGTISYQWDEADNLVRLIDALGRVTQMQYDALNRPILRRYPGGATESMAYDAVGNPLARTDSSSRTTTLAFDAMGRLVERRMPDGARETYAYNGDDQRTLVTDGSGTTRYDYDALGRLALVTLPDGAKIAQTHDSHDNLTSLTTSGSATSYGYDALDRLTQATGPTGTTQYFYDRSGDRVRTARPNGALTDVNYDSRRRPVQIAHAHAGTTLQSFATQYSASGRRTQVTEASGAVETFGYDGLGRLASNSRTGAHAYAQSYSYDAVGNRTQVVRNGTATNYTYDVDDRLLSGGAASFSYDANGNRVSRTEAGSTITYGYDARDRLVTTNGASLAAQYRYDADGNRIAVSDSAGTTHLIVANTNLTGWPQVVEERDAAGATRASYAWADELSSLTGDGATHYPLRDAHGSVRGLAAADGALSDQYVHDAWGRTIAADGGTRNPYRFDGERTDDTTGLYDLRARQYDPDSGRFLTRDPLGGRVETPISRHRYAFANDDPANFSDPGGQESLASLVVTQQINSTIDAAFELGTKVKAGCSLKERLDVIGNLVLLGQLATGAVALYQFFDAADSWAGPKVAVTLYGLNPAAFGAATKEVKMKFEIPWNLTFNFKYANGGQKKGAIGPKGIFGSISHEWWARDGYQCGIPTSKISLNSTVKVGGNTFNMSAATSASLAFRLELFKAWQLDFPLLEVGAKVKDFTAKGNGKALGFGN